MITPPTDSLYKFVAITGLILLIWGLSFPLPKYNEFRIKDAELALEINKAKDTGDQISREREKLTSDQSKVDRSTEDGKEVYNSLEKQKTELTYKLTKINNKIKLNNSIQIITQEYLKWIIIAAFVCVAIGISSMVVGFLCWYKKIQIHLDRKMRSPFRW